MCYAEDHAEVYRERYPTENYGQLGSRLAEAWHNESAEVRLQYGASPTSRPQSVKLESCSLDELRQLAVMYNLSLQGNKGQLIERLSLNLNI